MFAESDVESAALISCRMIKSAATDTGWLSWTQGTTHGKDETDAATVPSPHGRLALPSIDERCSPERHK